MRQNGRQLFLLAAGFLTLRLALYALLARQIAHLPSTLCLHDCSWYLNIATAGYQRHSAMAGQQTAPANWAFLPLYPLLTRALAWAGPSPLLASFILSNLSFLGFMLLGYHYLQRLKAEPEPIRFFAFLTSYPFGIYFSFT